MRQVSSRAKVRGKDSKRKGLSLGRGTAGRTKAGSRKARLRHRVMPNRSPSQVRPWLLPLGPTFLTFRTVFSTKCLDSGCALCRGSGLLLCSEKQGWGFPLQWEERTPSPFHRVCLQHLFHTECKPGRASLLSGLLSFLLSSLTHTQHSGSGDSCPFLGRVRDQE